MLVSWLKATLSEPVLAQVVHLKSAYDIWQSLAHQYATRSRSHKAQLRLQLQTLKKDDLVLAILGGLPKDYNPLHLHVTSQRDPPDPVTVDELHGLLLSHEMCLESQIVEDSLIEKPSSALHSQAKQSALPILRTDTISVFEGTWERLRRTL
eukprot:TRINITY_DN25696_c0_g1_i4.p1 TRINITY_DN25696_c0_g1~~TRINITY_DN25696_c0_g1_i4.p1  ORF type:complete len:152 (-),score=21.93 TRINITY_DN25696_c0_g1_i4:680-1135(-)